jgi:hypothetical protein
MRVAGALFHVMDVARDIPVIVMMSDPVEHADLQVIDGIMHRLAPGKPCRGVFDGALRQIAPSFRATIGIRIYTCQRLPRKAC